MNTRNMVISIIGRPNVGKSSLFNRFMKRSSKALTHDQPGVTRDRHYGMATFDAIDVDKSADAILVDTGGFYPEKVEADKKGLEEEYKANTFFNIMKDHAYLAIAESDLVLFVVDVREGVLPFDQKIADYIRTQKKEIWLVINKYDTDKQVGEDAEFYSLGLDPDNMFTVSAAHNRGLVTLEERLQEKIINFEEGQEEIGPYGEIPQLQKGVTPRLTVVSRLALIGAPNAGKSTLLNRLIGTERALVSPIAGTTVDPIEGYFDLNFGQKSFMLHEESVFNDNYLLNQYCDFRQNNADVHKEMVAAYQSMEPGQVREKHDPLYKKVFETPIDDISEESEELEVPVEAEVKVDETADNSSPWRSVHIVDTAGIRKQRSIDGFIEGQSVYRSLRCISESDIVVLMVDGQLGVGHQDRRLIDIAIEKGKSVIIALNKVDLLKEKLVTETDRKEWLLDLKDTLPWLEYCDLIPISAKNGTGIKKLNKAITKTILVRRQKIPTGELNRAVFDLVERNPVVIKGNGSRRLKVKYASMVKSGPPTFLLFTNRSKGIPENFRRYLRNGLRGSFNFDNTPVHLIFRTGSDLEKRASKLGNSKGTVPTN
ncbi:MAG: GTP-binding protein [Halobacteriovoraceae bacterium]|jgi:GTPase|nr:GTP-binding protein [Halobacteriovoraceae bacterium]